MSVLADGDTGQQGEPRAPRLDEGTELVGHVLGVKWVPAAGEAVVYVARSRWDREEEQQAEDNARSLDPRAIALREQDNRERAARRARSSVRRYVTANGCTRMLTLTFAPTGHHRCSGTGSRASAAEPWAHGGTDRLDEHEAPPPHDLDGWCRCGRPRGPAGLAVAMETVAGFVRVLRNRCNEGRPHPYVLVPEYHRDGHVHVHVLLPFFVPKILAARLWDRGFVDVRKFRAAGGGRAAARRAAAYASKYVGKTFTSTEHGDPAGGRHRYEVGEGYQPASVTRTGFATPAEALTFLSDHGEVVVFAVASEDCEDYSGPPWLWVVLERVATA